MAVNNDPQRPRLGSRALFPDLQAQAYLAHAAISPASTTVRGAVTQLLDDYARRGVHAFGAWSEQRALLRNQLARLIRAPASSIALTAGTTRGITDLASSIAWRAGDRVVCFQGEFPANVTPWQELAKLHRLEISWLPAAAHQADPATALEQLETMLRRGVRVVAVSAVQFQTGLRMPLEDIGGLCRRYGAELFVDAIQACGALPVDVEAWRADYLVCGAHKWLLGLEGAGFLYVHPERVGALRPYVAGWLSYEGAADFLFQGSGHLRYDRPLKQSVEVFEGSTSSAVGYAALGASVGLLLELGIEGIASHIQGYLDELEPALLDRGFETARSPLPRQRSGILSVSPPVGTSAVDLHRHLNAHGIVTSLPDGWLRMAPHWPNSRAEIPAILSIIDEFDPSLCGAASH